MCIVNKLAKPLTSVAIVGFRTEAQLSLKDSIIIIIGDYCSISCLCAVFTNVVEHCRIDFNMLVVQWRGMQFSADLVVEVLIVEH